MRGFKSTHALFRLNCFCKWRPFWICACKQVLSVTGLWVLSFCFHKNRRETTGVFSFAHLNVSMLNFLQHGTPPLLTAAGCGNIQMLDLLMRTGAQIHAKDKVRASRTVMVVFVYLVWPWVWSFTGTTSRTSKHNINYTCVYSGIPDCWNASYMNAQSFSVE